MNLDAATEALRARGLRLTRLKRAVLEQFLDRECAFTAEELGDRLGLRDDRSPLYRCLASLEEAGILTRLYLDDGCRRFDLAEGFGSHHHHLVCTRCSAVARVDGCLLQDGATRVLTQRGFLVQDHQLVLRGLCPSCHARSATP